MDPGKGGKFQFPELCFCQGDDDSDMLSYIIGYLVLI
jgi:hypothetical protein